MKSLDSQPQVTATMWGNQVVTMIGNSTLRVISGEQLPLLDGAIFAVQERVEAAVCRTMVHTHARISVTGDRSRGNRLELAAGRIDLVDRKAVRGPVIGSDERDGAAAERKAGAQVDVVDLAIGAILDLVAGQVVDRQAAMLIGAEDRTQRWIARMHPDRGVVGRIATVWHGRCFDGCTGGLSKCSGIGLLWSEWNEAQDEEQQCGQDWGTRV
jgi:hypothetical protein